MGTRSGDLDPACLQYVVHNAKNDDGTPPPSTETLNILNKKSRPAGPDRRVQRHARRSDRPPPRATSSAQLTIDIWAYSHPQVHRRLRGGDGRSGRAGLHRRRRRERRRAARDDLRGPGAAWASSSTTRRTRCAAYRVRSVRRRLPASRSAVIPTNEELAIARDTLALVTPGK